MFTLESRDFTIYKFIRLCEAISSNYTTVTMTEYLRNQHPDTFVLLRHDVDRIPKRALVTAQIEHKFGIKATYYFRTTEYVFKPDIICQIRNMGHEIGYHYETLSEAKGDKKKAFDLFKSHLDDFRDVCEVKTICMHGRPLSRYDNRELWSIYDYKDLGIIGEAYLSVGNELNYFSDTGRTWGFGNKVRDYIPGKTEMYVANTTDDLIELIKRNELNNFYILAHPERWHSSVLGWNLYYLTDLAVNFGKKILCKRRIEEIQEKAKVTCQISQGTPTQDIACTVNREVKKWEIGSQEEMTLNVSKVFMVLKSKIPHNPENKEILDMIESIKYENDLSIVLWYLSYVVGLIPTVNVVPADPVIEKIDTLERKIDDIIFYVELGVREEPRVSEALILHIGPMTPACGLEYVLTIPLEGLSNSEIKEELKEVAGKRISQLSMLPKKTAKVVEDYLVKNKMEDLLNKLR